ncbi:hypothetical protein PanWU01x14_372280, partial [Parasponia andersonii]
LANSRNFNDGAIVINPDPNSVTPKVLGHRSPFEDDYGVNVLILLLNRFRCFFPIGSL